LTKNGEGDLVVMDINAFTRREAMLRLREVLIAAEEDRLAGRKAYSIDEMSRLMQETIGEEGNSAMQIDGLRRIAESKVRPRKLSKYCDVASVASALVTDKGNIYVGVCIDTACSMGFCAEHSAIAQMITNEESRIASIVAVGPGGKVYPPCGRCREFMYQINNDNLQAEVLVSENQIVRLNELLPHILKED